MRLGRSCGSIKGITLVKQLFCACTVKYGLGVNV